MSTRDGWLCSCVHSFLLECCFDRPLVSGSASHTRCWKLPVGDQVVGRGVRHLDGREGPTTVTFKLTDGQDIRVFAAGDGKLSKGVLGAIPLHLVAEKANIKLAAGQKLSWEISVEPK